jgi:hypothetical protein
MTVIAVLQRRTAGLDKPDLDEILDIIEEKVRDAELDIFVGPEYLFRDLGVVLTADQRAEILERLMDISAESNTVLFPGTIVWQKVIGKDVCDGKPVYINSCPVIYNGRLVLDVVKSTLGNADHGFIHGSHIENIDENPFDHIGKPDFGSLEAYIRSHEVVIDGKKYFVEICDDHAYSRDLDRLPLPHEADYQIIISSQNEPHFITPADRLFVKDRGLIIECNGQLPSYHVGVCAIPSMHPDAREQGVVHDVCGDVFKEGVRVFQVR